MVSLKASTLRPGLLVSLRTSVRGNVSYVKETIDGGTVEDKAIPLELDEQWETKVNAGLPEWPTDASSRKSVARWKTTRTVADVIEYEAAIKVRGKARALISAVCAHSAFGMLCPETASDELDKAVAEARELADKFNATARITRVSVYVIAGRIAPDDVEAVKAINSEICDLMDVMAKGIQSLEVEKVREAANRAKSVAQMLSPNVAAQVQLAVEAARGAARKIVAAGEQAAQEIDMRAVRAITEARGAFLDLDGGSEVAAPVEAGRGIDLAPENVRIVAPVEAAVALEF